MNSLNDLRFFELDIICFCEQMLLEIFGFRKFAASSYAQISFFRRAFFFFFCNFDHILQGKNPRFWAS